jgi:hypothetical protein
VFGVRVNLLMQNANAIVSKSKGKREEHLNNFVFALLPGSELEYNNNHQISNIKYKSIAEKNVAMSTSPPVIFYSL